MSTAVVLPNNSRINYRQSRGATPNPSRPTSYHGSPIPSVSPYSVKLRSPSLPAMEDETLQQAIQEYLETLSDDDKAAFRSAPDIMERLQEMQRNGKFLISNSLTNRVEKVLQCVKSFMGSLTVFIQHSPEISSLVVGGINCILTVGSPYSS